LRLYQVLPIERAPQASASEQFNSHGADGNSQGALDRDAGRSGRGKWRPARPARNAICGTREMKSAMMVSGRITVVASYPNELPVPHWRRCSELRIELPARSPILRRIHATS